MEKNKQPQAACRCTACQIAVSHGAPEEDRDYEALRTRIESLAAELAQARERYEREKQMSVDYEQLAHESGAALRAATARAEASEQDARRYRWLCETDAGMVCAIAWRYKAACAHEQPDAAIDAALAEQEGK